jgi:hypothetical protein
MSLDKYFVFKNSSFRRDACLQYLNLDGMCSVEITKPIYEERKPKQRVFEITKVGQTTKCSSSKADYGNNLNRSSESIICKLDGIEQSVLSNVSGDSRISFEKIKQNLGTFLSLANKCITGAILQIMYRAGRPLPIDEIKQDIAPIFSTLRKSNGGTYNCNLEKSISSTLIVGKMFLKQDGNWWYKENEVVDFIMSLFEKEMENSIQGNTGRKYKAIVNTDQSSLTSITSNNMIEGSHTTQISSLHNLRIENKEGSRAESTTSLDLTRK